MVDVFAKNVAKEKQQWWKDGWNEANQIRQREIHELEQERIRLEQERRDSVRKMLGDGVDLAKISNYTGLTLEEIKALNN